MKGGWYLLLYSWGYDTKTVIKRKSESIGKNIQECEHYHFFFLIKKGGSLCSRLRLLSGHWRRVKDGQLVVQTPLIGKGLFAPAGDIKNKAEKLPAHIFNRFFACGDGACVDIH